METTILRSLTIRTVLTRHLGIYPKEIRNLHKDLRLQVVYKNKILETTRLSNTGEFIKHTMTCSL